MLVTPKTEIENCYPIKSPLSKGVRGLSFPLPLREGARGRGNLKGELFTLTLSLSRLPVRYTQTGWHGRQVKGEGTVLEFLNRDLGLL